MVKQAGGSEKVKQILRNAIPEAKCKIENQRNTHPNTYTHTYPYAILISHKNKCNTYYNIINKVNENVRENRNIVKSIDSFKYMKL